MLGPGELVMATPDVVLGAEILVVIYMPETAWHQSSQNREGTYTGWSFLHSTEPHLEMDLHFFNQMQGVDKHVEQIILKALPGVYWRESGQDTFERDDDEGDT